MNFITFNKYFSLYTKQDKKVMTKNNKPEKTIICTYPEYLPDPKYATYWLFCKYSLIKFKPFVNNMSKLTNKENPTEDDWISEWNSFKE